MSNLKFIEEAIGISNNSRIQDLSSLHPDLKVNQLYINGNDSLNTCNIPWICNNISTAEDVGIYNNGPGCENEVVAVVDCACNGGLDSVSVHLRSQENVDYFGNAINQCGFAIKNLTIGIDNVSPIENLDSLIGIDSIFGHLNIGELVNPDSLLDFSGIQNLKFIGGEFGCYDTKLLNLDDFNNILHVGGYLYIINNQQLTDISGLDSVLNIGGNVDVYSNDQLSVCGVPWLCNYLSTGTGQLAIEQNGSGCETVMDIIDHCGCSDPITVRMRLQIKTQDEADALPITYGTCPFPIDDLLIGFDFRK